MRYGGSDEFRLSATGNWIASRTGKFSRSELLDGVQRHPVSHPVKPRIRSRPGKCRGRLGWAPILRVLPAAAARISPSLAPPSGGRSHLPLPPPRPPPPPPSPLPRTPPPHPPRRRRVRCLPVVLAVAARTLPPPRAGEPGERWIYIHCQFK